MKYNGLNVFLSFILLLIFFSCTQKKETQISSSSGPEKIQSIVFSNIGGKLGNYKIVKITQDSVCIESGTTVNNQYKKWCNAISPKVWGHFCKSLPIKVLDSIRSQPSLQPFDQADETFQIKTSKKNHFYVNSYNDTVYYHYLQDVKNKIQDFLPK